MAQGFKGSNGETVGVTVCFEGQKRLTRQLRKLDVEAPKAMKAMQREAAGLVAADMRQHVPGGKPRRGHKKKPGGLARSIRVGATAFSGFVKVGGTAGVPYAGPRVFGWAAHNIEADHFPFEALDRQRPAIVKLHAVGINRIVDETITRTGPD